MDVWCSPIVDADKAMTRKQRHQLRRTRYDHSRTLGLEVLGKSEVHDLIAKAILAAEQQRLVGQVLVTPDVTRQPWETEHIDEPTSVHHLQSFLQVAVAHFMPAKVEDHSRIVLLRHRTKYVL